MLLSWEPKEVISLLPLLPVGVGPNWGLAPGPT